MANYILPVTFGTLPTGTEALSALDTDFDSVARMGALQCSAIGTNTVTLTSLSNYPTMTAYGNKQKVGFVAANATTGSTTIGYSGLAQINAYQNDGVTQIGNGSISAGSYNEFVYNSALNTGLGGWQRVTANAVSISAFMSSTVTAGSAVSLTNATAADVTSLALPPGTWNVWGEVRSNPGASTVVTNFGGGINTSSSIFPNPPNGASANWLGSVTGVANVLPVGMTRISSTVTVTAFLLAYSEFTVSTQAAFGFIGAESQ